MPLIRIDACRLLALLASACAVAPAQPGHPGDAVRAALAPAGRLRVGLISVPVDALRDPYSGELRGVSHDLGRELAARLRVPFEPIVYPNPGAYLAAGRPAAGTSGRWAWQRIARRCSTSRRRT
jgi:polar amino acid transport system substrate-binding protein